MYFECKYLGIKISIDTYAKRLVVFKHDWGTQIENTLIRAVFREFKANPEDYEIIRL